MKKIIPLAFLMWVAFVSIAKSATYTISIHEYKNSFYPPYIQIRKGDTVKWVNYDFKAHTIMFRNNFKKRSPILRTKEAWSYTFDKIGEYDFFSANYANEGLMGLIEVRK